MIDYGYKDFADLIGKDHGEVISAQRILNAIKRVEAKVEPLNQNVNLLIQDVRQLQAKLDALENRLLPPGYAFIQKPSEITPAGQVNIPTVFTPPGPAVKSYAEKDYADMTLHLIDKEPKS